jgi:hypothetical protein
MRRRGEAGNESIAGVAAQENALVERKSGSERVLDVFRATSKSATAFALISACFIAVHKEERRMDFSKVRRQYSGPRGEKFATRFCHQSTQLHTERKIG